MAASEFTYKGKAIVIREDHPHAVVSVDGREFACHHHHGAGERGLAMWMCDEAYFASPEVRVLAKHFADYGYMFDDPNRIVVDSNGVVVAAGHAEHDDDTEHGGGH
ncbi:hypothetical protein ACFQZZ_32970 [Nocardia sp. GCM10030253]|uniref:hypothetical protein n=1 Tax=Nocardia sp. GCM10030253 TaxID=3273404 RepID=UPI003645B76C